MPKAELGEKQICPSCSAKFYDLGKRPAVCPKCSNTFDPTDEVVKLKRVKTRTPVYETEYEDDEEAAAKRRPAESEDGFEEEVEETRELDAEAAEADPDLVADDEEITPGADALPPGFSEAEDDLPEDAAADADDDGVPLLEDDEDFVEDELAEVDPEDGEAEDPR